MEKLDRGIVAVKNNSSGYFISWRYFATDPEDIQFNLYARKVGATEFTKINDVPLTMTNYSPASGAVYMGTKIYVTSIINGVESEPSPEFIIPTSGFATYRSGYLDITYRPNLDTLEIHKYSTKFIWPADLDGDGEYDFVVDRLCVDGSSTHKIQGYLRTGKLLWTVDMGPNVNICQGQNDMVTAYDMDGDGKAEVIIKSSDGTKFANGLGVNGSTTFDTDNDGIIDYRPQNTYNPPWYITFIDGMTGNEKSTIAMKNPSNYTSTNKSIFMGTEYASLDGHMAIIYLDGKHPSVGYIYLTRTSADKYHWYYASAYGYNQSGNLVNWYNWERGYLDAAEAHSIRAADVDLDGRDELLDIGYGIKYDGTVAFNAHISHGDRFRTGDIDPERPGLETFAIQQNASSLLGQLVYDAGTGEALHKYYMSAVGDVGRGECMDVDPSKLGYEFWSTMPNIYDAQGNIIYEGSAPFPFEGVWWDGDLAREQLSATNNEGSTAMIEKYNPSTHSFGNRLIEFAKMTNWQVKSEWGARPAFFGDIIGDWREEIVLEKRGTQLIGDSTYETCPGFVAFSTDYPTDKRIYCLMQNPAYRCQATTKGYYQSPIPDFYLGYDMPTPPISPVQQAKLTWVSGTVFDKTSSNFVLQDEKTISAFSDGDDVMFDISGDNSAEIQINSDLAPSKLWAVNPKGHDYILSGSGKFTGTMELVKSLNGAFTINGNQTYTGKTIVSEGILYLNGASESPVYVMAKGTLGGNAIINGGLTVNQGLNIEGGRLAPGNGLETGKLGKISINNDLNLTGKTNLHFDILPTDTYINDSIVVNGNLSVSGINDIVINTENGTLAAGTYSLLSWTGTFSGDLSNFEIAGISGLPMTLIIENKTLKLVVKATRDTSFVEWRGYENSDWDFFTNNFNLDGVSTYFVNGDSVLFNDDAILKTVNLTDNMLVSNAKFTNTVPYILQGTGGISGNADLIKTAKGLLDIQTTNNTYTGKTIFTNAKVQTASLADAGEPSSLGATTITEPSNFTMTDSYLSILTATTNSNRGINIVGSDTIDIPKSNGIVNLTGIVAGTGNFIKAGSGQINFSSPNPNIYTGETVIKAGTIALGTITMNTYGFGTNGKIRMENGAKIKMYDSSSDYSQAPRWYVTIPEGSNATINASSRCNINGTISGAGILNFYTPYVRTDLVAGGADFIGKINVITDGDGGDFRITANSQSFPNANINLGANVRMGAYSSVGSSSTSTSQVIKIGSLSGESTSAVYGGTYLIGSDNRDAVYNGVIKSGATITKLGTGTWTLTNAAETSSSFKVSGGMLVIRNTSGSATGTGTLTVSDAILSGTGTVGGLTIISANGKIMPGLSETTIGTLTMQKNVSLTSTATTIMKVSNTSNDLLNVTGTLYLGGTLDLRNISGNWMLGSSYKLFSAPTISGNFAAIIPSTPGDGLFWDTSRISEGIISVVNNTAVNGINSETIKVYPKVVEKYCFVSLKGITGKVLMEVFNAKGGKELTYDSDNNELVKLDFSKLQIGVYVLRLSNATSSFSYKLVKK
ncbi:putative Autotransporter-associated beta strand repeat protein [uncultured Paludibacter sp.]|nr:putative Autotransporter-associated beta strand repeat protein [uncultured Paludibacter sp.]